MTRIGVIRYATIAAAILMALSVGLMAAGSPTLAGTLITNQAKVDYSNLGGETYETLSNIVVTTVLVVPGVDITDGNHVASAPGSVVVFNHTLTNTANAPEAINIDVLNASGFLYEIFHDTDLDMNLTAADVPFTDTDGDGLLDTDTLEPGTSLHMFFKVSIPSDADLSIEALFGLTASSSLDSDVRDFAEDSISVNEARPYIDVHDSPAYAYLATEYEFKVSYGNTGDIPFNSAVITTSIASALEFVSANGSYVYDPFGRRITWDLGSMAAGSSGTFTVRVRVYMAGPGITYVDNEAALTGDVDVSLHDSEQTGLVTTSPSFINIVADPDTIVADGYSQSLLTATVLDVLGNPVPDGTPVTFEAEMGTFLPNGLHTYIGFTTGGIATVILVAPLVHGFEPITSLVEVKAGTPETGEAYDTVTMTFSPAGILGVVWSSEEDAPVPGVGVDLLSGDGIVINSTVTGSDGRYMLVAPAIGQYTVRVHAADTGFNSIVEMSVDVQEMQGAIWSPPGAILGVTFLEIADTAGMAQASSLDPMAGVMVSLYKDGQFIAQDTTDEFGEFMFLGLPLGDYILRASTASGLIGFSGATLRYNGEVLISEFIKIFESGLVYDASNLAPIPGAEVTLVYADGPMAGTPVPLPETPSLLPQDNPALTNLLGHYIFFAPAGNYVLKSTAFGYLDYVSAPFSHEDLAINAWIPMQLIQSTAFGIVKASSRQAAAPGERVMFSLTWSNTSGGPLTEGKLVDKLPVELAIDEDTISGNGAYNPLDHSITWVYGNVNGSTEPYFESFYATIVEAVEDGRQILNRAEVSSMNGMRASSSVVVLAARKPGMEVTKAAGSQSAKTGDIVTYKVNAVNSEDTPTPMAAYDVRIEDTLPKGFSYISGSTYINGMPANDPKIGGQLLSWEIGDMTIGESNEIVYKAGIGPGAVIGSDSVNYAYAYGTGEYGYPFEVGPASASVLITGPAFSSLGAIIGKVYNDKDADSFQDKDEEGISGAEIIMDDGMRVITDEGGLYHITQVKPGVRSLKLNMASLPFKAEMTNSFSDITGTSSSFLVDVYPSGTVRTDFAVRKVEAKKAPELDMKLEVNRLMSLTDGTAAVMVWANFTNLDDSVIRGVVVSVAGALSEDSAEVAPVNGGVEELIDLAPGESGNMSIILKVSGATDEYSSLLIGVVAYLPGEGTEASTILARGSTAVVLYDVHLPNPVDGFAITAPDQIGLTQIGHISIKTTSPLNIGTTLMVNGVEVPKDKVGTTTRDGKQGKLFLEYVSVEIGAGKNYLELIEEKTGRKVAEAIVLLAGQAQRSLIVHIPSGDGLNVGARVAAAALVLDDTGIPAGKYVMPSFMAIGADFVGKDAKPQDEGFHIIGGELGNYDLLLTIMNPEGGMTLTSEVGEHTAQADLSELKPKTKPLFIAGTIELTHNMDDFNGSYIKARAFLRKEFTGGVLTLRFDSEQGTSDGMYSDASDDTMYNLYGDTSVLDNASPSASPFYAKFAAKGFYAMWGDFQPAYQGAELSSFKSKFTGFSAGSDFKGLTLGAFVAPMRDGIKNDRIEADGTSGYFFLEEYPILAGSESIYIILASRDDETTVLERIALKRALDYEIDYSDGSLLLNQPVPSHDDKGNKYFIEAVYTTPGTEITGLAAGGRVHADFGAANAGITASMMTDFVSTDVVVGADFGLGFGDLLRFYSEAAVSFADGFYGGYAVKAGAASRIGKVGLNLDVTATDGGFVKLGEADPMPMQIAFVGKAALGEESPLILSVTSSNYWKGAGYDFSSENKLVTGYRLPFNFDLSLGLITTFAYDAASDAKGAIIDAFVEASPIPELRIAAYAQIANIGEINDRDGDYSLSITYKPTSKIGITLAYVTGIGTVERHHTLSLSADVAVTKEGKVFGKLKAPFTIGSAKVLSLGYADSYTLCEGLRTNFLLEGAVGFTGAGIDAESTRVSASGSLKYSARNGFTASLKQEVAYGMADRLKTLTMLIVNGKLTDWLTIEGTAAGYYGNSPNREGLPLTAEASLSLAARPANTIFTGLMMVNAKYFRGEHLGIDEAAVVTTAVTDWTLEAGKYMSFTTKAGYKLAAEGSIGERLSLNSILLLQGGASLHITKTTDVEAFVRSIGWADNWKLGYSVQIVQKIFNLFSVAAGYNSKDLADTDIVDQKPWNEGFYLKALIKF